MSLRPDQHVAANHGGRGLAAADQRVLHHDRARAELHISVLGLHAAVLAAPAGEGLLRDLQRPSDLSDGLSFAKQNLGFAELSDHLLRGVTLGLHVGASPSPIIAGGRNSHKRRTELRGSCHYELIEGSGGETPRVAEYETERLSPARAGEKWPTPSQLSAAYGSWLHACCAAFRLWAEGSHARVAHTNRHAVRDYALYRRQHVVEAIHRFRVRFGHWPTQWEYQEWSRLRRRVARLTGQPDPRLPMLQRISELCSSWDRAVALAIRAW